MTVVFQVAAVSVLHVVGELNLLYRNQQITLRHQDVPGIDDVYIRVGEAKSFHDIIVFMKRLVFLLIDSFKLVGLLFSNPKYYHVYLLGYNAFLMPVN